MESLYFSRTPPNRPSPIFLCQLCTSLQMQDEEAVSSKDESGVMNRIVQVARVEKTFAHVSGKIRCSSQANCLTNLLDMTLLGCYEKHLSQWIFFI